MWNSGQITLIQMTKYLVETIIDERGMMPFTTNDCSELLSKVNILIEFLIKEGCNWSRDLQ